MIDSGDLAGVFSQKPECYVFVEFFDLFVPIFPVERSTHYLSLLGMERFIAAQHEIPTFLAHEQGSRFTPCYIEILTTLQYVLGSNVGCEVDSRRDKGRFLPGVLISTAQTSKNLFIFARNCHRIVHVDGVGLEMVGKSSQCEFVEDA